jgi:hypothetical protein
MQLKSENYADLYEKLENDTNKVKYICMSPLDYTDIRKFGMDLFDMETRRDALKMGIMGSLYGAVVINSNRILPGNIYFFVGDSHIKTNPKDLIEAILNKTEIGGLSLSIYNKETASLYCPFYVR